MRALKDNRGLTLIEVMMAILISFIVFLGLTETILVAVNANVQNGFRDEAVRLAESEINTVRNIPYDNLVVPSALLPASSTQSRTYRQMTKSYTITRSVADAGSDMRQVTVMVSWTHGTKTDNTTFTTIVRKR